MVYIQTKSQVRAAHILAEPIPILNGIDEKLLIAIAELHAERYPRLLAGLHDDLYGLHAVTPAFFPFNRPIKAAQAHKMDTTNQWMLWTASVLCAIGLGTMQIMAQVWLVKSVPSARRGVANSTYYIAMNLGHTLGGCLGGIWIGGADAASFFYYSVAVAFLPLLFTLVFRKQYFATAIDFDVEKSASS